MSFNAKHIVVDIDDHHFLFPLKELELGMRWIICFINMNSSLINWLK